MIVICEPQCKSFSHEKVNSGFLYALRLAFPNDRLVFYAHYSHIVSIKSILEHDKIYLDNIEYKPIQFSTSFSRLGMFQYRVLLEKILRKSSKNKVDKIFFLSFSAPILYIIKTLKQKRIFANFKFAFVLHGDFENIASDIKEKQQDGVLINSLSLKDKIKKIKFKDAPAKALALIKYYWETKKTAKRAAFGLNYPIKKILFWEHSRYFRYIALSPHILENAKKYIDTDFLNIHTVFFPTVFAPISEQTNQQSVKFAVFGYGNSEKLKEVLSFLYKQKLQQPFEIRIIGMDIIGTEGYENVTCPSRGKPLTRQEMEFYAGDIDLFLILYDERRYRLSCSGSIVESLSYMKPIIHFSNPCINFFNRKEAPIGFIVENAEEYALKMAKIINNYPNFKQQAKEFRDNIYSLRNKYSIPNSTNDLQSCLNW